MFVYYTRDIHERNKIAMQTQDNNKRARSVRTRLYHAGINISDAAAKIGRTREHVSRVLTGAVDSTPVLDALEELLLSVDEDELSLAA